MRETMIYVADRKCHMRVARRTQAVVAAVIFCIVIWITGCGRKVNEAPEKAVTKPATQHAPVPIPEAGPLANPRPRQQAGLPIAATRERIPRNNPQTPEKIS